MGIMKTQSELSPDTVLPQRQSLKNGLRNLRVVSRGSEVIAVNGAFTEISFFHYHNSCKDSSLLFELPKNVQLEKGVVHDSSRDVTGESNVDSNERRTKIEISSKVDLCCLRSSVECLCNTDEVICKERSHAMNFENCAEFSGDFIEFCPSFGERRNNSSDPYELKVSSLSNGYGDFDFPCAETRNVSSAPSTSESSSSFRVNVKSRFNPIRKVFEPFVKTKYQRSQFEFSAKPTTGVTNIGRKKVPEFFHVIRTPDIESISEKSDSCRSSVSSSPVHLHGYLKVKYHQGAPCFKFSLNGREQVLVAKLWKLGSGFNWTYTFHSICGLKRKNLSGWGLSNGNSEASLIGQMQVSCKMGSSSDKERAPNSSMMTEFVLYDISHARLNVLTVPSPEKIIPASSVSCLVNDPHKDVESFQIKSGNKRSLNHKSDHTISCPCSSEALHTGLEIAAIVIELPFEERESLKYRRGDIKSDTRESSMLTWPVTENITGKYSFHEPLGTVKVLIPNGHHSLGTGDAPGPSTLLDRWRFGGQCDCGGWDMACSLTVLGNGDKPLGDDHQSMELYPVGRKEKTPAMTFSAVRNGEYAVDFHAQLSTLQAFSICVAMLHTTEASYGSKQVVNHKFDEPHSVAVFIEDEISEAVREIQKSQDLRSLYIGSFPFSPISRV